MSNRRRKLTLKPRPGGFGELPAPDDPDLPALVAFDCTAGQPRWWPQAVLSDARLNVRHAGATHAGLRRKRNDDVVFVDHHRGLYIVCDGVGGRPHGGVAAYEAASAIDEWVAQKRPASGAKWGEDAVASASRLMYQALQHASRTVHRRASDEPDLSGMRTTASVVLVEDNFAVIGQVGDSRIYLARGDHLHQLTEDHTLRNLLIKSGHARPDPVRRRSDLTRSVGRCSTVAADVLALPLVAGDRLLLCTDGLHGPLADDDLVDLFELDVADAALAAIRRANELGGPDNVSALFVELAA